MATKKTMTKQLQTKLIGTVVEFMARAGVTEPEIRATFNRELVRSGKNRVALDRNGQDGAYKENADLSADLLRLWHRDNRYIDRIDAKPRPLHFSTGRNSVRSMVLSLDKEANASSVLTFMRKSGLLKKTKDGRYLPTEEAGTITQDDAFVVEHLVRSVIRLFSTMRRNTSAAGKVEPLIERYAYVRDLNPSDRRAFAEFTKSQGLSYLQAVDDWMEQRRVGRVQSRQNRRRNGVVAGVQVVAYLGDAVRGGVDMAFQGGNGRSRHSSQEAR